MTIAKTFDIPKPQTIDKNADGSVRFETYEDYIEALVEWKFWQLRALTDPVRVN